MTFVNSQEHKFIERILDIRDVANRKSLFLLGPRSTGKSALLRELFPHALRIDLLQASMRRLLHADPGKLSSLLEAEKLRTGAELGVVIIDEIQKVPELLDEVHILIEEKRQRFILTGSSARKLRRSGANMLGGRASKFELNPLTWYELKQAGVFDLLRYLNQGGLPRIYLSEDYREEFEAYAEVYLQEEIREETSIRGLRGFENFLSTAGVFSGELINYTKVASDLQLSAPTVKEYVSVLEDTLLLMRLPPISAPMRKSVVTEKLYLFDVGMVGYLRNIAGMTFGTNDFGWAFEHFLIHEVHAYLNYRLRRERLSFWRDKHGHEVDLIVAPHFAVEIKGSARVSARDSKNLVLFKEEGLAKRHLLVSCDTIRRADEKGIEYIHWEQFLEDLWADRLVA